MRNCVALMLAAVLAIAPPALAQDKVVITGARAINGDTLEFRGERVRLAGIDAPEPGQECVRAFHPSTGEHFGASGEHWPCGAAATEFLAALLDRNEYECQRHDVRDRYDDCEDCVIALCAEYYQGGHLGAALVYFGMARDWRGHTPDYREFEFTARRDNRGIWNGTHVAPWEWRRSAPQ